MRKGTRIRIIAASVICLLLITGINTMAAAREAYIDGIDSSDGQCKIYVNQNHEDTFLPSATESKVSVDGQEYEIQQIQALNESSEKISYVCMVDISGSMSQDRIDEVKKMIGQLADGKKPEDQVCITLMGNELNSSDFMEDAAEIKSYVEPVEVTKEDTNLYASIKEEIEDLLKSDLPKKKYLIIFSDGADDQATGITQGEAETAVKESHIPVFTVAMLKENPTEMQLEGAKILGSFARYSSGGHHFAPVVDGYGNEEVYGKIQNYVNNSLVVTANVSGIETQKNTISFSLTLSDGTESMQADYETGTESISQLLKQESPEEITPEPVPEPTPEPAPEPEEEPKEESSFLVLAIAGAVVVAVILVIIIVVLRKKGKQEEEEAFEDGVVLNKPLEISLKRQGGGEGYTLTLKNEIKIGRSRRCQLSIPEDAALSEVHCSLHLRRGVVYIVDEDSTNGTYVNGVPIVGEFQLEMQDIILFGSYEYQISWI